MRTARRSRFAYAKAMLAILLVFTAVEAPAGLEGVEAEHFDPMGRLLTVKLDGDTGNNTLLGIEPDTGAVRAVNDYPGFSGVNSHNAIDVVGHRYFFAMDGRIFSVDSRTGAVLDNPTLSQNPGAMNGWVYDPDSGNVLTVMFFSGDTTSNHLMSIDVDTGTVSPIEDYPTFVGINALSTIDPATDRYFFAMAGRIFTVNSQTGALVSNPMLSESAGQMIGWEYDKITDRVLTVMFKDGNNTLMSVNPATGTVSPVKAYPGFTGLTGGLTAIDTFNGRFYFAMNDRMFAVDVRSGTVLANPPMTVAQGGMAGLVFAPSPLHFFVGD